MDTKFSFLHKVSELGVSNVICTNEKRNVRLTNQISLVLISACFFIICYRVIIGEFNPFLALTLWVQMALYTLPLVLNRFGKTVLARILVCWLPTVSTVAIAAFNFSFSGLHDSSTYTGFRFFTVALGCFPFLVFSLSERKLIALGLLAPVLSILLYNPILNFFDVGYLQMGLHDSSYSFNTFRAFLSLSIINIAIFLLKQVVEENDRLNSSLMDELREKNKMILERAVVEVTALDEKLLVNVHLQNERLKELTLLHQISQVLQNEDRNIDDSMQEIVSMLPSGWQYPEIAAARILIAGIGYKTNNFETSIYSMRSEFTLPGNSTGLVEVVYLEKRPVENEGPFFKEERDVIDMIARMLKTFFSKLHESVALKKSEANLNAIINNTERLIWSVDRNLDLIAFNKPFYNHIKDKYGVKITRGSRVLLEPSAKEKETITRWEGYYGQAFEGKTVTFEERRFNMDFHHSLNPIVEEDGSISGVNVFSDDITDEKIRAGELARANKKIGELRLMALRSVMNPHFVFNALNSIQSFIVKNDRLNAINYLSMFSKLIRGVLNHSVSNRVKLNDEIEMLRNYVQLEMVRFENKFDFILSVDREIDTENIDVPSLLIQPYVENAILHGLCNKEGTGKLKISVREVKNAVLFEIEDDGIGRAAAMALNRQKVALHKSMAMRLTEERLRLINENHRVSLQVHDLENQGSACGTRVSITVGL